MKLYSYWRSSSAWRVRIALAFKNIPCDIVPVHLLNDGGEQHRPAFRARNPLAQVPVLEMENAGGIFRLTQSIAMLEYLEERFPEPPLLPRDSEARARARQLAEVVNSGIQPLQNLSLRVKLQEHGIDADPVVKEFMESGLRALEELAHPWAGLHLVGDAPSFADVTLIPQLYNARRFAVDVEEFPTLLRVERACELLPAFAAAHPDAQIDREP